MVTVIDHLNDYYIILIIKIITLYHIIDHLGGCYNQLNHSNNKQLEINDYK